MLTLWDAKPVPKNIPNHTTYVYFTPADFDVKVKAAIRRLVAKPCMDRYLNKAKEVQPEFIGGFPLCLA